MSAWFYILECSDGSFYTGSTIDIDVRFLEHQLGDGAKHTSRRRPIKLVYWEEYHNIVDAFDREHQVNKWSRKKKEALINGDGDALEMLAVARWKLKRN